MATTAPPTSEQGSSFGAPDVGGQWAGWLGMGAPSWSHFHQGDELEYVPELKWQPGGVGAIEAYHRMRTDAQCQGLFLGSTLPIRRYNFVFEPNGTPSNIVNAISEDYNVPIRGNEDTPRRMRQRRFVLNDHLRHALLAIIYGYMYFEQVGEIGSDLKWHLRKLGVRMPQSIMKIDQAKDGGVNYVVQRGMGHTAGGQERRLNINRLLMYIWEQEGANVTGRSMFRGIYKNFLLKDTVLRVGAINIERAGGVPVVIGPKGATPDDLKALRSFATQFRVGANAGGAIPNGAELVLAKAAGGDEAVNYIKLQNEEMARGWLMTWLNMGQAGSHGSYALSNNVIDYALNSQEVIAQWFCDTFNEHMVEDHVNWNWSSDYAPLLVYKRTDDRQMALQDLVALIDKRVIQVDDELEAFIREDYGLPRRNPDATVRELPGSGSPDLGGSRTAEMAAELVGRSKDEIVTYLEKHKIRGEF